ncbi:MAG: DUF4097 family beta strand repeat-containing protein [Lachnospiraceae bacterium]|jgi:hypothetical protein|nr:DUF4097 family beta strand repeat-containing protein [Lachnospiraceae bacterium]HBV84848.1 hypothetical protein [Lachnospiraceae bacterium]
MSIRKNIWMAILTIITVCCVIGGTLYHAGIFQVKGGFRFGEDRMTSASAGLETFHAINVDADMMDLSIEEGDNFYLHGKYTDRLKFEYEVKDGVLFLKERNPRKIFWGGVRGENCNITLTIPQNTVMDRIEIKLAMGNADLENIASIDCEVLNNMGNCTFEKCSFDKADIDTNMGEITIKDTDLGKADVDNDMGTIQIERCIFEVLNADNSMGDISIEANQNLDKYQIELGAEMGNVKVNGESEGTRYRQSGNAGTLEASTSMGSVRLDYKNAE